MSGEVTMRRLRGKVQGELGLLRDVINPEVLHARVPKLKSTAQNRAEFKNIMTTFSTLGAHVRANGFDPTRTFQHVANIDTEIWALIIKMFAKEDEDGNLLEDGLLYKKNEETGAIQLNKPFFYMIVEELQKAGYNCDYRSNLK